MDLILWRHCEAEDGHDDLARELTSKGHRQARRMAGWLATRLPDGCRVIVSPARRTQQTIAALRDDYETLDVLAPGASVDDVLDAAAWPLGGAVLVVGHQPTLGDVASHLLVDDAIGWSMKKGAIVWLTAQDATSPVKLKAALSPDIV